MIEQDNKKIGNALIISGALFTLVFWLGLIIAAIGLRLEGTYTDHLSQINDNPTFYVINFVFASLTGPLTAIIMVVLTLFVKTRKPTPLLNILSLLFLSAYLVLVCIAYASQYTYFMNLLRSNNEMAIEWLFRNFNSIPYFIQQLGYMFFALSGILLGYRFLLDKGIKRVFGYFLEIRCLITIVAFIGLALGNQQLNYVTIISGLLTAFLGIFAIAIGINVKKI
ncbi:hypothetical protein ACFLTE_12370 [Bacteroidota bacterium]